MSRKEVHGLLAAVACLAGLGVTPALAVDDLSLNVDPVTECVSAGETVTVRLDVANLSCAINGVQVLLRYDPTILSLVDIVPTDLGLTAPDEGWVEISETDNAGDVDWAAVINGGSILIDHRVATATFTAVADGTATVVFRPDAAPKLTKLTCASDSSTVLPTKWDTTDDFNGDGVGDAFVGLPDCTITAPDDVCEGTSNHSASVPDEGVGASYSWSITGGTIDSGAGTPSITFTAGTGTSVTLDVTVTDANGCSTTCQKIVNVNANPDCTITSADSVCANTTGHTASVPLAVDPATYTWAITGGTITAGNGTDTITFDAGSGTSITLDVTIDDGNGCTSTCQKIISVAAPDCTITAEDEVCDGTSGHVASVPDAGAGATYAWTVTGGTIDSGAGTPSISYTATDPTSVTIDVTVTSGDTCSSSCQKIVTVNPNPDATITTASAVCAGTSGHSASVPDAGVGATYDWVITGGTIESSTPFGPSITYTAGTGTSLTIDVTVTDANGCVSSSQAVVTVNANPDATITTASAVCAGTTGNSASVPDAGIGATYDWVVTGGTIESATPFGPSITYTAGTGTSLTIDVTVTDANGCVSSSQEIVTVNPNPDCTITAPDAVCDGSSNNQASVPDAGVSATYDWTITGGTIDSGLGTNSITFTATDPTSVTLDITVTDANGCVSSCQKIITVSSNPTCSITADDAVCDGSTGNIASTADVGVGATYDWVVTGGTLDSGQNTTSISYTATDPTSVTIDLTVTDSGGCVSTCQKVVTVNPNPDATITTASAVCAGTTGNSASVPDAGVGATYDWVVTGGTIESATPFGPSITYTAGTGASLTVDVTVTDANGCVSSSQEIVTVNPNPDATITTASAVCAGTTGNSTSVPDAGVGATYDWVITGGTIESATPFGPSITYTAGTGTSLTIDVTVTDANGCVSSSQEIVTVNPNPDATITTASAVCAGTTGNSASVPDAGIGATYDWVVTGGTIESATPFGPSITYTAGTGTSLTIDVTVTDGNGCVSSSQAVVAVDENPIANAGLDITLCDEDPDPTVGATSTATGGLSPYTYEWTGSGAPFLSATTAANPTFDVTLAGPGVYDVCVTVTDSNGCASNIDCAVVTVNELPLADAGADIAVCADDADPTVGGSPTASFGLSPYTYLWTGTAASSGLLSSTTEANPTFDVSLAGVGVFDACVTVTDTNGCVSATDCTTITVNELPVADAGVDYTLCADAGDPTLGGSPTASGGLSPYTYLWTGTAASSGLLSSTTEANPTFDVSAAAPGSYDACVTVTDSNLCDSVVDCATITINALPDCTITSPTLVCEGSTGHTASAPVGASNYSWTITGGTIDSGQGTDTISFSAGAAGTLTLDVTVTDANGCVSTCQQLITVDAPGCTISSADSVCFQSTGNLATAPSGLANYSWTIVGGTITSQTDNAITYAAGSGTSLTLEVTTTNSNGCTRTCQKVVTIIQPSLDVTLQMEAVANSVTRDVTFVITDCDVGTQTVVVPVTTDASGVASFTVDNISDGAEWVSVQEGHTLRRLEQVSFGSCFVAPVTLTLVDTARPLLAGDFHTGSVVQDNLVDVVDFSILATRWNTSIDPNLSSGADATGDGFQDTADFTAIQVNYFVVGEALDGCPATADAGTIDDLERVEAEPLPDDETRVRTSVPVNQLHFDGAEDADMNRDGVVDAADVLLFADQYELRLQPEFKAKLSKIQRTERRSKGRR